MTAPIHGSNDDPKRDPDSPAYDPTVFDDGQPDGAYPIGTDVTVTFLDQWGDRTAVTAVVAGYPRPGYVTLRDPGAQINFRVEANGTVWQGTGDDADLYGANATIRFRDVAADAGDDS